MMKELINNEKSQFSNDGNIQISLKKTMKKSPTQNNDFLLPSQNKKYDRYSDFIPVAASNPKPKSVQISTNQNVETTKKSLNAMASEYIPGGIASPITPKLVSFNPYLTPQNAHTANPFVTSPNVNVQSSDFIVADENLLNDPNNFNEDEYECWQDENGEIIVVKMDEMYSNNTQYDDVIDKNDPNIQQKGIRSGGNSYCYGIKSSKNGQKKYCSVVDKDEKKCNLDKTEVKMCQFWLNSTCAFGKNCKLAHRFSSYLCPHCDVFVGKSPMIQQQHLAVCEGKKRLIEEHKISQSIECGICRENVLAKGQKFGLLTGCNHSFCLLCIREWRGTLRQKKEIVRSCPICRKLTHFIVPSERFVTDKKRKEKIVQIYKERLAQIRCKHFDESEECPFGSSCFYKHIKRDGTIQEKKVNLRHMINANGKVEIMKEMKLSEFLFGPE